ncbi:hypothetical protein AAGS61_11185 [Lysinibacillus sp. KU-BSD001]|uniref:hypothetical protein n=1 Tax=Lysinibacillus sp. KU-BSD001 TaxID=3141328 RepID=UPI0036E2E81C
MKTCTCENCGRINLEMETFRMEGHVAQLCVTCAYVFAQNKERFCQMVRSKTAKQSNAQMKKQHQLLSSLIAIGSVAMLAILGWGIADQVHIFAAAEQTEYLSFVHLKQLQ